MARGGREGAAQKDEEVELKSPGATMCSMAMGAYTPLVSGGARSAPLCPACCARPTG